VAGLGVFFGFSVATPLFLEKLRYLSRLSDHSGGGRMASVMVLSSSAGSVREFFSGGLQWLVPSPRPELMV
jgi:hypothetical protein